jgi:hypothetical protein
VLIFSHDRAERRSQNCAAERATATDLESRRKRHEAYGPVVAQKLRGSLGHLLCTILAKIKRSADVHLFVLSFFFFIHATSGNSSFSFCFYRKRSDWVI